MDRGKAVRYLVIASIYNLLLAGIVYFADWLNDEFLHFSWINWDLASWWLFIACNLVLFGTLLFLAPWFERLLYYKLDSRLAKIREKLPKLQIDLPEVEYTIEYTSEGDATIDE